MTAFADLIIYSRDEQRNVFKKIKHVYLGMKVIAYML